MIIFIKQNSFTKYILLLNFNLMLLSFLNNLNLF